MVEGKIVELEKEKERLSSDIAKLKTENGIEENIRQKFGLAKEGENMIVIMENKNPPIAAKETEEKGFLSFFTDLFK